MQLTPTQDITEPKDNLSINLLLIKFKRFFQYVFRSVIFKQDYR